MTTIHTYRNTLFALILSLFVFSACSSDDDPFVGADNYINSFSLKVGEYVFNAEIKNNEITIKVPEGISLDGAAATVSMSENASIYPNPETVSNWNDEMIFAVIPYNGQTELKYKYTVTRTNIDANETVVLATQADIDAFGATDITAINGSLIIGSATGTDSITDLSPLAKLKEIAYSLTIHPNIALTQLAGFDALEKVGSDIYSTAPRLEKVSFPKLKSAGSIYFKNSALSEVSFAQLATVAKSINLECPLLALSFPNLKQAGSIALNDRNAMITTVSFPVLQKTESIEIYFLPSLTKILLPELTEVGNLKLNWLTVLGFINVPKLNTVTGTFSLPDTSKLVELSCPSMESANTINVVGSGISVLNFSKLTTITNLSITNTSLSGIDKGFSKLQKVEGELRFSDVPEMKSVSIPSTVQHIGKLAVSYQTADPAFSEINIKGLNVGELSVERDVVDGIKIVGDDIFHGTLSFDVQNGRTYNWKSPTFSGFQEVDSLSFGGYISMINDLEIKGIRKINKGFSIPNNNLQSLSIPDLEEIGGNFVINHLNQVQAVNKEFAMPKLKSIGGSFKVTTGGAGIESLSFPLLATVGGDFALGTGYASTSVWDPNDRDLKTISFPVLKSIGGKMTLKPYLDGGDTYVNKRLTNLDGFSALKSVKGVEIVRHTGLVSYAGLKGAISSFTSANWVVSDNGYNPTYQDLVNNHWTKP